MNKTLRIVLGDQLNIQHSWYTGSNKNIVYALFEIKEESKYVKHHIQKVVGFFLAMRNFAEILTAKGLEVVYFKINDANNKHHFIDNIYELNKIYKFSKIEYQCPDEHRLEELFKNHLPTLNIPFEAFTTEHFYTSREELSEFSKGRKKTIMEDFYRYMRKKHHILVENDTPIGGKWNYDASNRKKWNEDALIPLPYEPKNDCKVVLEEIKEAQIETFGIITSKFTYPVSRAQALVQLKYFCDNLLPHFGDYQDAMHTNQDFLFHSKLSFALNIKLISPREVVNAVQDAYHQNKYIDISQAEGFIRQILGWREYMRGMYWQMGKTLKKENFFTHQAPLPDFFWTGDTKMNCIKESLRNSLQNSYAHHIQRLMILGNFALLLGVDPDAVDAWYLGVYIDAVEWVQLPNTRGMSQFADGGIIATKPYVSSATYINKMSNYCKSCHYNHKTKLDSNSCPFNTLYWDFLHRNKALLNKNHRMRMMYALLRKMEDKPIDFSKIIEKASSIKSSINKF